MYLTIGKSPLHLLLALVVALIVASAAFILLVEDVLTLQHPRPVAAVCILRLSGLSFVLGATYLIQRLVCKMRKWMVRSAALHLRRRPLRSFLIPGAPLDSLAFHENSLVWSSEFTHWKGNKWFFGGKNAASFGLGFVMDLSVYLSWGYFMYFQWFGDCASTRLIYVKQRPGLREWNAIIYS